VLRRPVEPATHKRQLALDPLRSIKAENLIACFTSFMNLPFDAHQFLAVFAAYNEAIWPAQLIAYGLGFAALGALLTSHPVRERVILAVLSLLWVWNGLVYQLVFFSPINPMAKVFATLFVVQAMLFGACAIMVSDLKFKVQSNWRSFVGLTFIVYAMLIYEMFGDIAGHGRLKGPLFGVAPCPTVIFTIGLLLQAHGRSVAWLSLIPIVWALIGGSAAVLLNIPEDFGLAIAGGVLVIGLTSVWLWHRHA
jgi:hypothetical protein